MVRGGRYSYRVEYEESTLQGMYIVRYKGGKRKDGVWGGEGSSSLQQMCITPDVASLVQFRALLCSAQQQRFAWASLALNGKRREGVGVGEREN